MQRERVRYRHVSEGEGEGDDYSCKGRECGIAMSVGWSSGLRFRERIALIIS